MRKNRTFTAIILVVVVAFIFTVIAGCGQAPAIKPAVKKPIKIGFSIPFTGAAAEKGQPIGQGELDAMKYINEELGGIDGNKVEVVWYDTAYNSAIATTNVKKLMDEGCLFFTVVSSADATASKEAANKAGFPGLVVFSSPSLTHPPAHLYAQLPDYGDDWAAFCNYYLKNIWKGTGKPKMALEILSNSTGYGVRDAAKAAAGEIGFDIVTIEEHKATTISETDALTRIKEKKPDVLFIGSTPAPTSVILKNAYELKLTPGITVACGHAGFTKALVDLAGKDISNDVYGVYPTVNWGENVPGMAKMIEYAKLLHPQYVGNNDYLTGWASSLINAEIIKQALKSSSLDVLTKGDATAWQAAENQGFLKVKGYDVGGLHGPVDFSDPIDKRGSKTVKIFQIKNGELVSLTDWVKAPYIDYK
jgi:branched-chain amino acid transport system substrate-binding protein